MERCDDTADDTALREAYEEIGLPPEHVRIAGYLDGLRTVTNFWITPVVGVVTAPFTYVPAAAEVAEVIEVPIAELLDQSNWHIGKREYNGTIYNDCRFPFNEHTIWGATGKLTWALMQRIK